MRELCEHTILMNAMIGLAIKHETYPSILADKGYMLESICPSIYDNEGNEVNPDIIFRSHEENNLFFIDCKTGTLQEKQANSYKKISPTEILEQGKTKLSGEVTLDKTWVCKEKNFTKVDNMNTTWNLNFPIICKFNNNLLKKNNSVSFNSGIIEQIFNNGINLPKIPTVYYPFSSDDPEEYILMHLLPSIVQISNKVHEEFFTLDEILKVAHPLYEYLELKEKSKLKQKIGNLLSELERNELKDFLNRVPKRQNTWEVINKKLMGFRNACQKLITDYDRILEKKAEEKKQKKIPEF